MCIMISTYESADSHGMLIRGGAGKGMKQSGTRKRNPNTTHPRLQHLAVPIVICTTQRIQSENTSVIKRSCTANSPTIDDSMNDQLTDMVMDPTTKHASKKTNSRRTKKLHAGKRHTRKR
jgi:hypothetical protein